MMQKQLILVLFSLVLSMSACKKSAIDSMKSNKAESFQDFDCLSKSVDKPLLVSTVRSKIDGEWQLRGTIFNMPTTEVPDVRIIFQTLSGILSDIHMISLYEDGVFKHSITYTLKQEGLNTIPYVTLVTDKDHFDNGDYNFFKGTIRICDNELMIDNGIAFDAPGYLFRKIK